MRVRAPGKLVLSGAYAVLEGAPALVAAVDRYATAESGRAPTHVSAEVAEAVRRGLLAEPPWVDAAALRAPAGEGTRKLGLGSSAAILVAALGTARLARGEEEDQLGERLVEDALAVHRAAQGGGSGVDVAAACLGGVLRCQLDGGGAATGGEPCLPVAPAARPLTTARHDLPAGVHLQAYQCPVAAATAPMVAAVARLAADQPETYREVMRTLGGHAAAAVAASSPEALVAAIAGQVEGLAALGRLASIPIVTAEVAELDVLARREGACFCPSGAGGGDVAFWVGQQLPSRRFATAAQGRGMAVLPLGLGARGVHRAAL